LQWETARHQQFEKPPDKPMDRRSYKLYSTPLLTLLQRTKLQSGTSATIGADIRQ
jgi:hypothetical protein